MGCRSVSPVAVAWAEAFRGHGEKTGWDSNRKGVYKLLELDALRKCGRAGLGVRDDFRNWLVTAA
jgi:hypothetical protein